MTKTTVATKLTPLEMAWQVIDQMPVLAIQIINKYRLKEKHSVETGEDSCWHDFCFMEQPNSKQMVCQAWHYWGIIDHTKMTLLYQPKVIGYLTEWGVWPEVWSYLQNKIDGQTKGDLLMLALALHDVGKFAVRRLERRGDRIVYRFSGHEHKSGEIVRGDLADELLGGGLTENQLEYVAILVEKHYELARVREGWQGKYDVDFIASPAVWEKIIEIRTDTLEYAWEIGLMFLADLLAKSPYHTSTEEEAEELIISGVVEPVEHFSAVRQMPVNLFLARRYFENC